MAAASSFNFILVLVLLLVILFSTTAFFTQHQLTNQVSGDNAVSSIHKVEEGVVNGGRSKRRSGRKILEEKRSEIKKEKLLVDVNGEISKRRSINHQYHNKKKRNIEDSGFVSLNSDYHPPRHHPPKNN